MSHVSVYVLDISVLLYSPDALYDFQDKEVVLPVSILDALDTFRQDLGEKGRAANIVSKIEKGGSKSEKACDETRVRCVVHEVICGS